MASMKIENSLLQRIEQFRVVNLTHELWSDRLVQGQLMSFINRNLRWNFATNYPIDPHISSLSRRWVRGRRLREVHFEMRYCWASVECIRGLYSERFRVNMKRDRKKKSYFESAWISSRSFCSISSPSFFSFNSPTKTVTSFFMRNFSSSARSKVVWVSWNEGDC